MDEVMTAFFEAADSFGGLVDLPEVAARWNEPSAMEGYTVGAVVGHVSAAIGWLEPLLERPSPAELRPIRLGKFYAGVKIETPQDAQARIHGVVRDRSNEAAQEGAEANAERFRSMIKGLGPRLAGEQSDRVVDLRPLVPRAMRLGDFLRTRTMELVVHADDLAASIGVDAPQPSPAAAAVAIEVLISTARASHGDLAVIRALARRERSGADVFPVF